MTDLATFHVATISAGQFDPHAGNEQLSSVSYDQKTHYYDFTDMNVTREEFENFIAIAWEWDEEIEATDWGPSAWRVSLV